MNPRSLAVIIGNAIEFDHKTRTELFGFFGSDWPGTINLNCAYRFAAEPITYQEAWADARAELAKPFNTRRWL